MWFLLEAYCTSDLRHPCLGQSDNIGKHRESYVKNNNFNNAVSKSNLMLKHDIFLHCYIHLQTHLLIVSKSTPKMIQIAL